MYVVILSEGSREWGMGHLHRCQGFARFFQTKSFAVRWLVVGDLMANAFLDDLQGNDGGLLDWFSDELLRPRLKGCFCAIVDSYRAPPSSYELVSSLVPHCIWLDDNARIDYPRGIVANPNPLVAQQRERLGGDGLGLLSGFQYQILRPEFSHTSRRSHNTQVSRVLVMMGGTDLRCLTPRVVRAIEHTLPDVHIDIVLANQDQKKEWSSLQSSRVSLFGSQDAAGIHELMMCADLAVTAAGQTLCEAASVGLPVLAIGVAENQRLHSEAIQRVGAIRLVGWYDDADLWDRLEKALLETLPSAVRRAMGDAGQNLIDGVGLQRIVSSTLGWSESLEIRLAVSDDSESIWHISNHPSVRENSIHRNIIPFVDHQDWYQRSLANPDLLFFAVERDRRLVGQIRYLRTGSVAIVSISLAPEARGQGSASCLLREGDSRCFAKWPHLLFIEAEIALSNVASEKSFARAGYRRSADVRTHGDSPYSVHRKGRDSE